MKSLTKHRLSNAKIRELVRANFGDDEEIGEIRELKGGFFNSAYSIERLRENDKIVLKVSVAEGTRLLSYEKRTMDTEVEMYRLLAEKTTVPAPKVLACDFSKQRIPSHYFFMTLLEGVTMNHVKLDSENAAAIQRELADIFSQIHRIKGAYFGYFTEDPACRFPTWRQAFLHMMGMILKDGKDHGIKLPYERYERILAKHVPLLDDITEPVLVDYDLHPGNIFLKKQGDRYVVEGIVDFERAFWGDPYADFPAAFLMVDDVRQNPGFWETYRGLSNIDHDLTNAEEIRSLLYRLYLFTIMQVEIYRFGFFYAKLQSTFSKMVADRCLDKLEKR